MRLREELYARLMEAGLDRYADDLVGFAAASIRLRRLGDCRADQLGLGLEPGDTHDGLLALADVGYVAWAHESYAASGGVTFTGLHVTGRGLQALGQWPTLDTITTPGRWRIFSTPRRLRR